MPTADHADGVYTSWIGMDRKRLTILHIKELIERAKSMDDINDYSETIDILLCLFMSPILFISTLLIPLFGIYVLRSPAADIWLDALVMFFFASGFQLFLRTKMRHNIRHQHIAILYNVVLGFAVVRFYYLVGPALWTFAFIQILLSITQKSRSMLIYSATTLIVSGIYVVIHPMPAAFEINNNYIIVQCILFGLMYVISSVVFEIHQRHITTIHQQVDDLKKEVTGRIQAEKKSQHLALYDQLTQLPNRHMFLDQLQDAMDYSSQQGLTLYVAFIDIDFFKLINDTLGHSRGDELLMLIGNRLSNTINEGDCVGRVSGDEFVLMFQETAEGIDIDAITRRILRRINEPFQLGDNQVTVSCSMGIARFPEHSRDAADLIKYADIAMYKAKEDGKNQVKHYAKEMELMRFEEIEMINALQDALIKDEFELYYQPQVHAEGADIVGYEALIRWNHPVKGMVGPGYFIPSAEKSGFIVKLGEWVLRTACAQNKRWQEQGYKPLPVAVNISIHQITNGNLDQLVQDVLQETGLDPRYLEMEITETMFVEEAEIMKSTLRNIHALGVRISIDDFGTGYSALQHLKRFPVDRIKIPMDFIHGINHSEKDESIISVILALAESLDTDVVAEGVETDEQYLFLKERDCHIIQGYYFHRPMSVQQIGDCLLASDDATHFSETG